jgi:3-phosphoshikimate 1-carboxyvinyltransferase
VAGLTAGLTANGVQWRAGSGTLVIGGQGRITGGGTVVAAADPRIALVFLMMGMATRDPITVMDHSGLDRRYPGVLEALTALGATFKEERA